MTRRPFTTLAILVLGATTLIGCSDSSSSPTQPPAPEAMPQASSTSLSTVTAGAMDSAIDDEYKARAFYDVVIEAFGPVVPFVRIRDAETRHIEALVRLYIAYALTAPSDP